ncbi:MAG: hypothetical protein CL947_01910, partial [Epsilonproteobacteria bacterium]|nr:hypothetical protein [Campylobacterota bacterium]
MRCLIRGALLGTLFFLSSLLHSQVDIQEQCTYQLQYDQYGNPNKLCIEAYRIITPIIDGILVHEQREEYICKQEYDVTQKGIQDTTQHVSLQVNVPKYKEQIRYNIPESQVPTTQRQAGFYTSVQSVPHQAGIFESMSDKQLRDYLLYDAYCKKQYQMDACAKCAMMALRCNTFKKQLLSNTTLSDGAVLELLNDYLHGCNTNKQKYKDLEQQVTEAIKARNQSKVSEVAKELEQKIAEQKMQVEQELRLKLLTRHKQSIEQQHQTVQDLYWVNDYVSDEIEQAREEALQQTEAKNYIQYDQSYTLDAITCGYLSHQHIAYLDYLHCYGTALQQQYHQEICDILTQAAHQHVKIENLLQQYCQSPILEHATNFAQAAQQTNQKDWTSVTGVLTSIGMLCVDCCKEVYGRPLDYARAIQGGVVESAYDFGHMMLRFDKAIYSVGQMLYFVLETGAMTDAALRFPESNMTALQERHGQIAAALFAMQQDFFNKDGPARVKAITKFGTDFYLPAKLTHAIGYLIGGISSRARGMRILEGVSSLLDESLITAETAEKIREIEIAAEQGFTQKVAAEFMEADSTIAKAGNIAARPLNVIIDEVKKLGGVIPYHRKDLLNEAREVVSKITKEFNGKINKNIMNKYRERIIIKNGI